MNTIDLRTKNNFVIILFFCVVLNAKVKETNVNVLSSINQSTTTRVPPGSVTVSETILPPSLSSVFSAFMYGEFYTPKGSAGFETFSIHTLANSSKSHFLPNPLNSISVWVEKTNQSGPNKWINNYKKKNRLKRADSLINSILLDRCKIS